MKPYFDMSRKEQTGAIVLIGLIVLLFMLQYMWIYVVPERKTDFSAIAPSTHSTDTLVLENDSTGPITPLDPNTASETDLLKTGLSAPVVKHIVHYREKGGHFYKTDDLKKIYGLTSAEFNRLASYINIPDNQPDHVTVTIDLNTSDSLQLLQIKGIGPVFASRILAMRQKLGAFFGKEQLLDVYGIDEEKYAFIKNQVYVSKMAFKTVNINKDGSEVLKTNPYIRYKLAGIIVQYRQVHGPFKTVEDLKNIIAIDEKTYHKLHPYISVR